MIETVEKFAQQIGVLPQVAWVAIGFFGCFILGRMFRAKTTAPTHFSNTAARTAANYDSQASQSLRDFKSSHQAAGTVTKLSYVSVDGKQLDIDAESQAKIKALLESGNIIQAIKLIRECTGASLVEAKGAAEKMMK